MHRARRDALGEASTCMHMRIYRACTCRHNYTYKEHTRRRQVTVAPACRTDSRRVLLDNAPVDGRTNGQTHISVIVLSQEEAGPALSASLALDSYRKTFPTRFPSPCHISFSLHPLTLLYLSISRF